MSQIKPVYLILLILLNAVPLYGVFFWNWQSFDLIFLYWLENLIIGLFTLIRFLVRPYSHPLELIFPLFLAPFFAVHYGGFCFVHGSIVIALFGGDILGEISRLNIPEVIMPIIDTRHLFWPVAALLIYQLIDYIRDSIERGLGSDNIKTLMVAPYRRIIVLHLTIIASGFALAALDEPLAGLVILVVLKTSFDIYHWLKDEKQIAEPSEKEFVINEKIKTKIDEMIKDPKVIINGKEIRFDSYEDFQASKYYGMMQTLVRLTVGGKQLKVVEKYIQQQLADNTSRTLPNE